MGDTALVDCTLTILHDPMHKVHMGITADNVAERYGITRDMMDALAATSHQRAAKAIAEGRFASQIVPVSIATRQGSSTFEVDEHVKPDTSIDALRAMKPAFKKDGLVTAGNSSGINDGSAAVVLADAQAVRRFGVTPLARLVSYAHAGVDPLLLIRKYLT